MLVSESIELAIESRIVQRIIIADNPFIEAQRRYNGSFPGSVRPIQNLDVAFIEV